LRDAAPGALLQAGPRVRPTEEKFQKAFRNSPDAMSLSRLKDGRYLDVSAGFERIFGYSPSEVISRTSTEVGLWVDPADRAALAAILEAGSRLSDQEIRYRTKAGEGVYCNVSAQRVQVDGEDCILARTRGVTHRKNAQPRPP